MARRTQVILEDDIDGGTADQTVTLTYNGVTYELDLSKKNAEKLDKTLEPYSSKARRTGRRSVSRRSAAFSSGAGPEQLKDIRAWERANGHKVSDRGRISAEIVAAYEASR